MAYRRTTRTSGRARTNSSRSTGTRRRATTSRKSTTARRTGRSTGGRGHQTVRIVVHTVPGGQPDVSRPIGSVIDSTPPRKGQF